MMSTLELNPEQEIAANHIEGPLLVLAGAGSGKTRVVTHRICRLIDLGILPSDILAVTFTNKAAEEMRLRIRMQKNTQVLACTFHSLGVRILRESIGTFGYQSDFAIYDEEDSEKLLKNCLERLQLKGEKGLAKEMRQQISAAKNNLASPAQVYREPLGFVNSGEPQSGPDLKDHEEIDIASISTTNDRSKMDRYDGPPNSLNLAVHGITGKLLAEVYDCYQTALKECNALDFDDLLYLTVKLLQENQSVREMFQTRWQFVLIDEYQDTNLAQYTLAKLLVEKHQNIFAVGDPDQSIYSWRGARYQNILNFERDFPGAIVIVLDQNYRSTNNILQAANALIEHNPNRYEKKLWSAGGEGEKIGVFVGQNERQEAAFVARQILKMASDRLIPFDDIAIFYRTNAQSRTFEDALLASRIDYSIIGGLSFYARREIKDILAYLRLVLSNTDRISFLRTINLPKRGLGPAALDKLIEAADQKQCPIFTFCEELVVRPDFAPNLKLSAKQQSGLASYVRLIQRLRNARPTLKIHELIAEFIAESSYIDFLKEDPETMQDRKENIDELIGKAAEWEEERDHPTLQLFLEELTLRSTTEEKADQPSIKLMTLHNSKGLEFSLVFLVGLEEDLCPHINSKDSAESLEEERRLCYVGMTRARKYLYLTASTYRFMWGTFRPMRPSRFFKEIPVRFLQNLSFASFNSSMVAESSASRPEGFSIGEKVYHQQFGAGIVQKAYDSSLGLTYEVYFPDSETTRTLAAKFAKLSIH